MFLCPNSAGEDGGGVCGCQIIVCIALLEFSSSFMWWLRVVVGDGCGVGAVSSLFCVPSNPVPFYDLPQIVHRCFPSGSG